MFAVFIVSGSLPWVIVWVIVVRQLTMSNIEYIIKYVFLKNRAMFSILCLGMVMILEGFKIEIPEYITPMVMVTILIIIFFFIKSKIHAKNYILIRFNFIRSKIFAFILFSNI